MAKVPNGVKTLPKISIGWVGRTNVTDDRRQTDARRHIANLNLSSRSLKTEKEVHHQNRKPLTYVGRRNKPIWCYFMSEFDTCISRNVRLSSANYGPIYILYVYVCICFICHFAAFHLHVHSICFQSCCMAPSVYVTKCQNDFGVGLSRTFIAAYEAAVVTYTFSVSLPFYPFVMSYRHFYRAAWNADAV